MITISSLPGASALLPQARTAEGSNQLNSATGQASGSHALIESSGAVQDQRQTALEIVNRTLTAAYEKISNRGQVAEEYRAFEPLTAEKVANNILGFIERRLQMDVAEGATQEELQARLEAGLFGFKKGFAEASEKLEALSLLSPEIKTDIGTTYDLVIQGIDDLRSKFITAIESPAVSSGAPAKTPASIKSNNTPVELDVPDFLPATKSPSIDYGNYEYGSAREFSFSLTTKEGDRLTIKATASEGLAVEAGRSTNGSRTTGFYNASYSASQSMSWQVEGDLNEEELQAINDLLGRVNDLAGQFFSGNLDAAFEQAVNLGYDDTQIGKFALNLTQVEIQQVTQAYKAFEPQAANALGDNGAPNLFSERLLPLGNFVKDLLDTLDRTSFFDEPELLVADVGEKITGDDEMARLQGSRFSEFMKELFALRLQQSELEV